MTAAAACSPSQREVLRRPVEFPGLHRGDRLPPSFVSSGFTIFGYVGIFSESERNADFGMHKQT